MQIWYKRLEDCDLNFRCYIATNTRKNVKRNVFCNYICLAFFIIPHGGYKLKDCLLRKLITLDFSHLILDTYGSFQ